jgi:hypothetical protein
VRAIPDASEKRDIAGTIPQKTAAGAGPIPAISLALGPPLRPSLPAFPLQEDLAVSWWIR